MHYLAIQEPAYSAAKYTKVNASVLKVLVEVPQVELASFWMMFFLVLIFVAVFCW